MLIGAGAIGTFVLTGLRHLADVDVTVIDFPGHRLERAARLGAAPLSRRGRRARAVLAATRPAARTSSSRRAERPGQLNAAIGMVRDGGTILQVGLPSRQRRSTSTRS